MKKLLKEETRKDILTMNYRKSCKVYKKKLFFFETRKEQEALKKEETLCNQCTQKNVVKKAETTSIFYVFVLTLEEFGFQV